MKSALMEIIVATENQLGWKPPRDAPLYRSRAAEHRKLTLALARHGYSEHDLRLALAYCVRRRQPIDCPSHLIRYVVEARELAAEDPTPPGQLDLDTRAAIAWEHERNDTLTEDWINRLARAYGPARTQTLAQWRAGGRGR